MLNDFAQYFRSNSFFVCCQTDKQRYIALVLIFRPEKLRHFAKESKLMISLTLVIQKFQVSKPVVKMFSLLEYL